MKKYLIRIIKVSLLSLATTFLITLFASSIILSTRLESMMTIKHVGADLYTMHYKKDYKLDKAIKAGLKEEDDLYKFISKEVFFGIKFKNNSFNYACSAFATENSDGDKIVGRNFDYSIGSDTLCLYTHPKGGYASISTVSTDMVAVGEGSGFATKSLTGRALLLAAPYIAVDGVNEKGLSASLLDQNDGETHMDTGKPKILVTLAIRLLLDKTSTVDEAINMLSKYDIQSAHGCTQHIFLSDLSGKSAIVEWHKNEMIVIDYHVCTNFRMSRTSLHGDYSKQCDRFDFLDNSLKEKQVNSEEESMVLLQGVLQKHCQWSVVYNLTDFTADYAVNKEYDNVYHIDAKKI